MGERERWREQLCHSVVLNEGLFGQIRDRFDSLRFNAEIQLKIDFDQPFFLCLTGIEKKFSIERLSMNREQFLNIVWSLGQRLDSVLPGGMRREAEVVRYDQSKRMCFIFALSEDDTIEPHETAQLIHDEMMALLREYPEFSSSGLCNVTALVEWAQGYESLSTAFQTARTLIQADFFLMESVVMTQTRLSELTKPCSWDRVAVLIGAVERAVGVGDMEELRSALRVLFLDALRWSFDSNLVRNVLFTLQKKLLRYSGALQLELEETVKRLTEKRHASISELYCDVLSLLQICAQKTAAYPHGIGRISLNATAYIRSNYAQEIGLVDVAENVGVTASYLSRVFNREVGESLPAYLTCIRISRAMALLENGETGVAEVGKAVGIPNPQYFGVLFKKQVGVTPLEYRRSRQAEQIQGQ